MNVRLRGGRRQYEGYVCYMTERGVAFFSFKNSQWLTWTRRGFFASTPAGQEYFKQSDTRLHFIAGEGRIGLCSQLQPFEA